ncbi:MAG: rhodanese-like domain-containing protein [Zoogloeaceae bacterium]|nr:rhodanese-like domain-containing protein [Zoogloeaceae bacterium]
MIRNFLAGLFAMLIAFSAHAERIDIDNAELARLAVAGVPVIDVRTEAEWKDTGVVPGSKLITLFDAQGNADPAWLAKVKEVAKPGQPVIIICRSGARSKVASQMLEQQGGYQKVYNVRHGIRGWASEGRTMSPAATAVATCPAGTRC